VTSKPHALALLLALAVAALFFVAADAARLRAARRDLAVPVTRALGLTDLALSSNARWLRHPTQAEPAAGTADAPYALDIEPAGGILLPPRALHADAPAVRRSR
jgi:hypothetical protein